MLCWRWSKYLVYARRCAHPIISAPVKVSAEGGIASVGFEPNSTRFFFNASFDAWAKSTECSRTLLRRLRSASTVGKELYFATAWAYSCVLHGGAPSSDQILGGRYFTRNEYHVSIGLLCASR